MADPNVIGMSNEEVGVYIKLICLMWNTEECSLKNDCDFLAKITHSNKEVIRSLLPCFKVVNSTLRHKRLDQERFKQDEYRKKCSKAGKKGMKKRWEAAKTLEPYKVVITKDNSSSSTSSSNNISTNVDMSEAPKPKIKSKEIDNMLTALKQTIGIEAFVDSRIERNMAKHCLGLLNKIGKDEFRRRLDHLLSDSFHSQNCNKIKYVYNNIKGFKEPASNPNNYVA